MTKGVPVSIVVPVRDEADRIARFVATHNWADEIIIVDNGSIDATATIAASGGARVLSAPGVTIGEARNLGADAARHEWILALDADEVADEGVVTALRALAETPSTFDAFRIERRNFVLGREQRHGAFARNRVTRCYRRALRWTTRPVHETLTVTGPVGTLSGALLHTPYRSLDDHVARMDRYARLGAQALHAEGRRAGIADRYLRPAWRWLRTAVFRGGLLDGSTGWTLARLDARATYLKYRYLHELGRGMERS